MGTWLAGVGTEIDGIGRSGDGYKLMETVWGWGDKLAPMQLSNQHTTMKIVLTHAVRQMAKYQKYHVMWCVVFQKKFLLVAL